jgi:putative component of membrane protein insertase Oxa1/YidC/SpoIIIJ protein YidD
MPGGDDELAEEERRRRQEQGVDAGDAGTEAAAANSGWCDGCDVPSCDGCDVPDCDCGGCDFPLLRVSTLLALVALVAPVGTGGTALVELLIRGYRRWLTRFTPPCPSEPSCSAYALDAVQTLGARRGLRAAARHVRACGARARK